MNYEEEVKKKYPDAVPHVVSNGMAIISVIKANATDNICVGYDKENEQSAWFNAYNTLKNEDSWTSVSTPPKVGGKVLVCGPVFEAVAEYRDIYANGEPAYYANCIDVTKWVSHWQAFPSTPKTK